MNQPPPDQSMMLQELYRAREKRKILDDKEDCEKSLAAFIRSGWSSFKPEQPYVNNWHIDVICEHLEAVSNGEVKRLQIWVPPGTSKPVDADALVLMGDGERRALRDVEVGDVVITHRGRPRMVTSVHEQGVLPTLLITTDSGRQVRTAADHPLLTPEGWKKAEDLVPGDVLGTVASPRIDEVVQPDEVVSIEDGGLKECRCLTVVEDGSFTANDLIVKNSATVSIFWPAWEWTTKPGMKFWGASYELRFAGRLAAFSRDLMMSDWYRERWGDVFKFTRDAEGFFSNNKGGTRLATAPESTGTGEHGHRILIDDPINAQAASANSKVELKKANDWYDNVVVTRGLDIGYDHARVLIMQRLHDLDLAEHLLAIEGDVREGGDWQVLCLPERYEPSHPFAWPDDPRDEEGELLWPAQRDEKKSNALARTLGAHRAAGQLQQRPAAKEGDLLLTKWWRFYDPRWRSQEEWHLLPKFSMVVMSIDCPLKDKESNDNIAIQTWGIHGTHRYLVDIRLDKMSYSNAKRAVREMARFARGTWPRAQHKILIENTGYGVDLILDLKDEFTGLTKINPQQEGDKVVRADRASDALESGHCFLPGVGPPWRPPSYEEVGTPPEIAEFIHDCSRFPNASHDDDVDAWSQMVNWMRGKQTRPLRTSSATRQTRRPARR